MKALDFVKKHGVTLKEEHSDWLTALKEETMADVWDNTNDPMFLIEILRCLLNPNYDTAIQEYLRDAIQHFSHYCISPNGSVLTEAAIFTLQSVIDGRMSNKEIAYSCMNLHKEISFEMANESLDKQEGAVIYATAFSVNWLMQLDKNELASISAAYHFTEHMIRGFDEGKQELSDKLRGYVGNPFT